MKTAEASSAAFTLVDSAQVRYVRKGKWSVRLAQVKDGLMALAELSFPEGKSARLDFPNQADQKSFANALRSSLKAWSMSERFKVCLSQDGLVVWIKNRK